MIEHGRLGLIAAALAAALTMTGRSALADDGTTTEFVAAIAISDAPDAGLDGVEWHPEESHAELDGQSLNAAMSEAIDVHPSIALPAANAAMVTAPGEAVLLFDDVRAGLPEIPKPAEPMPIAEGAEADSLFAGAFDGLDYELLAAEPNQVAFIPVDQRPKNWPIFPEEGGPDGYADIDPLRPINIAIFYVNGAFDYILLEPLAKTYAAIMPDEVEEALGRAYDNLGAPITFINDLLQLEFENAGITLARFVLNSTVGVGGLIDVAVKAGLPPHKADFGQTLHRYGMGDGIYLVLPLFGGTTLRDAIGLGVDILIDPRSLVFDDDVGLGLSIGEAIVRRAQFIGPADFLEAYAENHYEAARAWTYQRRERFLSEGCDQPSLIICIGDFSK